MSEYRKEIRQFFGKNLLQGLVAFVFLLVAFVLFKEYVEDHYQIWVAPVRDQPWIVYSVFFINELILGLIPPEFFMFLHVKDAPTVFWLYVTLMTVLSYLGGTFAFFIGKWTRRTRFMRTIMVGKKARLVVRQYHKYGGALIVIAAITPVPFALTSLVSGTLDYDFKDYVKFAWVRFIRFYPYAYAVYYLGTTQLF